MSKYLIPPSGAPREVTDIHYIDRNTHAVRQVIEKYYLDPVTKTARLVWEWITGFIFSLDSFVLQTKDGYIIKCKDQ